MIEWNNFNRSLSKVKDIFEYNSTIENNTLNLVKNIFPHSKIQLEQKLVQKYFYDFSIETSDFKLFCEVKREKISLIKFWNNNISIISNEIRKLNAKNKKKNNKYLLILIDSEDSLAKMNLRPIYDDILAINIKMLFKLQEFFNYVAEDIKIFIKNIFKEASGVLYDNFICNLTRLVEDLDEPEDFFYLDEFPIDDNILKLDLKSIFNKSFKLISKNQIDLLNKFLINYYHFDSLEYPRVYRKSAKSTDLLQKLLIKSDNNIYFHRLEEIDFNDKEIHDLDNLLNSLDLNFKIVDIKKCQISLLLSSINFKKRILNEHLIKPLLNEGFKIQIFDYESNFNDIIKGISKSNILMVDLIESESKAFYYLGRAYRYPIKLILLISEEGKLPDYLDKERFFVYKDESIILKPTKKRFLELMIQICSDI